MAGPHRHSDHHSRAELPSLTDRLRRISRKVTGPRHAILELLLRQDHPLSIREIFHRLPGGHCDLATVYRSMHLLEQMGMVKRFELGGRIARFELLREGDDGHHHHLVCTHCREIVELDGCSMRDFEENVALRNGFTAVTHKLEFFGICPACQ